MILPHSSAILLTRLAILAAICIGHLAAQPLDLRAQTTTRWISGENGDWEDAANWDSGVPVSYNNSVPEFNVEIDTAAATDYVVSADVHGKFFLGQLDLNSANATLNFTSGSSFEVFNDINLNAGRLHLERSHVKANTINLNGGLLTFSNNTTYKAEIENAAINGYFEVNDSSIELTHGALFTGDAAITNSRVDFSDTNVLLDSGQDIHLQNGRISAVGLYDSVLSIGRSVNVTGVGSFHGRVFNHGRIETTANRAFGFGVDLYGKRPVNLGQIIVAEGSTLNWGGVNRGTIELNGTLHSKFTTPGSLGDIQRSDGSKIILSSTWINVGSEIELTSETGDYILQSANIRGGKVVENGGRLLYASSAPSTFNGVDYTGDLTLAGDSNHVNFHADFRIGGDINIIGKDSSVSLRTSELEGGTFELSAGKAIRIQNNSTFQADKATINAGAILRGSGKVNFDSLINRGFIRPDIQDESLTFATYGYDSYFANEGIVRVTNGARLVASPLRDHHFVNEASGRIFVDQESTLEIGHGLLNRGQIRLNGGQLLLRDFSSSDLGNIVQSAGSRVDVSGIWDSVDQDFWLTGNTGDFHLNRTRVQGGRIIQRGGRLRFGGFNEIHGTQILGATILDQNDAELLLYDGASLGGDVEVSGQNTTLAFANSPIHRFHHSLSISNGSTVQVRRTSGLNLSRAASINVAGTTGVIELDRTNLNLFGSMHVSDSGRLEMKGGSFNIKPGGNVSVVGNSVLDMGAFNSQGLIELVDSEMLIGGSYSTEDLGEITMTGNSQISFQAGQWNNESSAFQLPGKSNVNSVHMTGGTLDLNDQQLEIESVSFTETNILGNLILDQTDFMRLENSTIDGDITVSRDAKLQGFGTVLSDLNIDGRLDLDSTTEEFRVDGNLSLSVLTRSSFAIDPASPDGDLDSRIAMVVAGEASLGGILSVNTIGDDTNLFSSTDKFTIALFESGSESVSGNFLNASNGDMLLTEDRLHAFRVHYGDSSIHGSDRIVLTNFIRLSFLTAVPEPNAGILLGLLLAASAVRRSRNS